VPVGTTAMQNRGRLSAWSARARLRLGLARARIRLLASPSAERAEQGVVNSRGANRAREPSISPSRPSLIMPKCYAKRKRTLSPSRYRIAPRENRGRVCPADCTGVDSPSARWLARPLCLRLSRRNVTRVRFGRSGIAKSRRLSADSPLNYSSSDE